MPAPKIAIAGQPAAAGDAQRIGAHPSTLTTGHRVLTHFPGSYLFSPICFQTLPLLELMYLRAWPFPLRLGKDMIVHVLLWL